MGVITLRNTTREKITIRSADGDSVTYGPGLTADTDEKFLWNLPVGIRQINAATVQVSEPVIVQ
jgi:hypothetical protein